MAVEIASLHNQILALERMVGLPGEPVGRRERQARVAELRARGYSTRAIAKMLHTGRAIVMKDCRRLGIDPAPGVVGLDGRNVPGPRAGPAGQSGLPAAG